jgi:hypothetical protein
MNVNANIFNSVHRGLLWHGGCSVTTNTLPPEGRPFIMREICGSSLRKVG